MFRGVDDPGDRIARALAPRLAARIAPHYIGLIVAPAEYMPLQLACASMAALHGDDGFVVVQVPEQAEELLAAIAADRPVLAEVTALDVDRLDAIIAVSDARFGRDMMGRVLAVHVADNIPSLAQRYDFDLRLDHRDLTATPGEMQAIHPGLAQDPVALRRALHVTGGVPSLLVSDDFDDVLFETIVAREARSWAERVFDTVMAGDITRLMVWGSRLPEDSLAAFASDALTRNVSVAEVREAMQSPLMTAPLDMQPGYPGALATALRYLAEDRDVEALERAQVSLARAANAATDARGLDRIMALTKTEDWVGLDRVLATSMHLLLTLKPEQRPVWSRPWPNPVPRHLPRLAHARQFLDGEGDRAPFPDGTPPLLAGLRLRAPGHAPLGWGFRGRPAPEHGG